MKNYKIYFKAFFLPLTLVICHCASTKTSEKLPSIRPKDLLILGIANGQPYDGMPKEPIQSDISYLVHALKSGYAGRDLVDQKVFNSVLRLIEELPGKLEYPTDTNTVAESLDKILLKMPDAHLHAETLNGWTEVRKKSSRAAAVGSNISSSNRKPWELKRVKAPHGAISILSIKSFADEEDSRWQGFKSAVEEWLQQPIAILDVRGNGGGSDVMARWLASRIKGDLVPSVYASRSELRTPEALALYANAFKIDILFARAREEKPEAYLQKNFDEQVAAINSAIVRDSTGYEIKTFKPDGEQGHRPYIGQVIVLLDAECFSACEGLVLYLEMLPNVLTVGENTAGAFHFGNVGNLLLPNSHVIVAIPTANFKIYDGRFIERVGVTPKIRIQPHSDALQYVLQNMIK